MQAIEFEANIEGQSIPLPATVGLPVGQAVRVVLLFDRAPSEATDDLANGPIAQLMRNPRVVPGFKPLTRDEAHER